MRLKLNTHNGGDNGRRLYLLRHWRIIHVGDLEWIRRPVGLGISLQRGDGSIGFDNDKPGNLGAIESTLNGGLDRGRCSRRPDESL